MIKQEKDFVVVEGEVKELTNDSAIINLELIEIKIPIKLLPKVLKEHNKIKVTISSLDAYEKRIEGNAKKILNEILGS